MRWHLYVEQGTHMCPTSTVSCLPRKCPYLCVDVRWFDRRTRPKMSSRFDRKTYFTLVVVRQFINGHLHASVIWEHLLRWIEGVWLIRTRTLSDGSDYSSHSVYYASFFKFGSSDSPDNYSVPAQRLQGLPHPSTWFQEASCWRDVMLFIFLEYWNEDRAVFVRRKKQIRNDVRERIRPRSNVVAVHRSGHVLVRWPQLLFQVKQRRGARTDEPHASYFDLLQLRVHALLRDAQRLFETLDFLVQIIDGGVLIRHFHVQLVHITLGMKNVLVVLAAFHG